MRAVSELKSVVLVHSQRAMLTYLDLEITPLMLQINMGQNMALDHLIGQVLMEIKKLLGQGSIRRLNNLEKKDLNAQ